MKLRQILSVLIIGLCACNLHAQRKTQEYPELKLENDHRLPRYILKSYPIGFLTGDFQAVMEITLPLYFSVNVGAGLLSPPLIKPLLYDAGGWDRLDFATSGYSFRLEPRQYFFFDERAEGFYYGLVYNHRHYFLSAFPPDKSAVNFMDFGFSTGVQYLIKKRICMDWGLSHCFRVIKEVTVDGEKYWGAGLAFTIRLGVGLNLGPK
jgi:hypothetical protein